MGDTTIRVPEELADELYAMKGRGESYADVIRGLLEARERLAELEQRVDELESDRERAPDESAKAPERTASRPRDPKGEAVQNTPAEPETSDIGEILSGWPGPRAEKRERRREVGAVALEWLRDRGEPASATDFKNALHDDHPVEGQSEDTWWRKSVRPALKCAVDAGVVEQREGYHDYRWIGERA